MDIKTINTVAFCLFLLSMATVLFTVMWPWCLSTFDLKNQTGYAFLKAKELNLSINSRVLLGHQALMNTLKGTWFRIMLVPIAFFGTFAIGFFRFLPYSRTFDYWVIVIFFIVLAVLLFIPLVAWVIWYIRKITYARNNLFRFFRHMVENDDVIVYKRLKLSKEDLKKQRFFPQSIFYWFKKEMYLNLSKFIYKKLKTSDDLQNVLIFLNWLSQINQNTTSPFIILCVREVITLIQKDTEEQGGKS
ncbi:hypothetical protein [Mycoplasma sp. Ms02]|uniref:hypothetical protein n=1 Tax=Mycoplasma sp. Ms02 TaxID=353851 RepID=UPI001C8A2C34|nr:hypothetical protein [Mycoplasma sp. Ms02]QZE12664.1 hypothetical protein K4L35_01615 [Mycoplasma sp. Ms02]